MEDVDKAVISTTTDSLSDAVDGIEVTEVLEVVPAHAGLEPYIEDINVEPDQGPHQDNSETTGEVNVEEKSERVTQFPMSRIKQIMKMDPDVTLASQEAVFVISKSTELFVKTLVKEAHYHTAQFNRKTLQKKDVESAISNTDCLVFLDGVLDV